LKFEAEVTILLPRITCPGEYSGSAGGFLVMTVTMPRAELG